MKEERISHQHIYYKRSFLNRKEMLKKKKKHVGILGKNNPVNKNMSK